MNTKISLGLKLRKIRMNLGLTQKEFGCKVKESRVNVNYWEHYGISSKKFNLVLSYLLPDKKSQKSMVTDSKAPATLLKLRSAQGLSQEEFGKIVGFTQAHISRMELGISPVPTARLQQIQALFKAREAIHLAS